MGRAKFDRVNAGVADVAVFRISGTLGFHENAKVRQLAEECVKREFKKVLFDFTDLTSLGGGVAKILREFVDSFERLGGVVGFVVTNDVVLDFLQDGESSFSTFNSLEDALGVRATGGKSYASENPGDWSVNERLPEEKSIGGVTADDDAEDARGDVKNVILMSYDGLEISPVPVTDDESGASPEMETADATDGDTLSGGDGAEAGTRRSGGPQEAEENLGSEHVFSELFGDDTQGNPPEWIEKPTSPFGKSSNRDANREERFGDLNKKLKRRILELKTLFSISKDFNTIRDRKKLLDIFLLTSIAQGGVESAVFFERREDKFEPIMSKGLDGERMESVSISLVDGMGACNSCTVIALDDFDMDQGERDALKRIGLEHICTFIREGQFAGLVVLGKRIAGRGMKREDFEFLQTLVTLAQNAYENAVMFEREHERTLGIVKTLISLIEENTLLKGTSEFVSRYVGIVAKDMGYAEEDFKDLIYGTVLRDMGMVKVSDLILRSPRDLTKEEWEIIKRHPEDGAEMLERMKFNDRVVEIVKSHHEQFNGEGYPMGLVGKEVPLGARIISVVESYAAMIHKRPNRPTLSEREALDTLKENYGLRYDREVVQHFAKIMEKEIAKSVEPGVRVE